MSVGVKICGITNVADAIAAVEAGADVIGFVFAASPRRVTPDEVRDIAAALPAGVLKAGVFVDEDPTVVEDIAALCGLDLLQFHGSETPKYCARFGERAVKAVRVKDSSSLRGLERYNVSALLLDTYFPGQPGGTGRTFDWKIAAKAAGAGSIILSGGLTPENVTAAVRAVRPAMVDVSSGVETSPGLKNPAMMRRFVINAKKEVS